MPDKAPEMPEWVAPDLDMTASLICAANVSEATWDLVRYSMMMERNRCRNEVANAWHDLVTELNLRPGSPVETIMGKLMGAINEPAEGG